jgi:hypothetical protein
LDAQRLFLVKISRLAAVICGSIAAFRAWGALQHKLCSKKEATLIGGKIWTGIEFSR